MFVLVVVVVVVVVAVDYCIVNMNLLFVFDHVVVYEIRCVLFVSRYQ